MFEKYRSDLTKLVEHAWQHPEPSFREFECSGSQVEYLKKMGFDVQTNVAGTVTGYMAAWGSGKPVIAILGEFDALYGLSQKADCAVETPEPGMNMGQGCGHHLLGVGRHRRRSDAARHHAGKGPFRHDSHLRLSG